MMAMMIISIMKKVQMITVMVKVVTVKVMAEVQVVMVNKATVAKVKVAVAKVKATIVRVEVVMANVKAPMGKVKLKVMVKVTVVRIKLAKVKAPAKVMMDKVNGQEKGTSVHYTLSFLSPEAKSIEIKDSDFVQPPEFTPQHSQGLHLPKESRIFAVDLFELFLMVMQLI